MSDHIQNFKRRVFDFVEGLPANPACCLMATYYSGNFPMWSEAITYSKVAGVLESIAFRMGEAPQTLADDDWEVARNKRLYDYLICSITCPHISKPCTHVRVEPLGVSKAPLILLEGTLKHITPDIRPDWAKIAA